MNIAICDDSMRDISSLQKLLAKYRNARENLFMQTHVFLDGRDLLERVRDGQAFDLFLLDIIMPYLNGINLARAIRGYDENVPLIFLTGTSRYALDAYSVSASDYLLKPIQENALFPALDKAVAAHPPDELFYIPLPEDGEKAVIPLGEINFVEMTRGIMRVYLSGGKTLVSGKTRMSFVTATAPLNRDSRFVKAAGHRMLNMAQVKSFTGSSFIMRDDEEVPIPNDRCPEVGRKYRNYLSREKPRPNGIGG